MTAEAKSKALDELRRQRLTTEWESFCDPRKGCGIACCHHNGSPCEELKWTDKKKGVGVCQVYPTRFGKHKTVDGQEFICVSMGRYLLEKGAPPHCGYQRVTSVEGKPVVVGMR